LKELELEAEEEKLKKIVSFSNTQQHTMQSPSKKDIRNKNSTITPGKKTDKDKDDILVKSKTNSIKRTNE